MSVVQKLLEGYLLQVALVFFVAFLLAYNYYRKYEFSGLPPGPWCFPLLGSLPSLGPDMREPIRKMGQKYGDIFSIYLGGRRVVVLNSYSAIREALVKNGHVCSNRPDIFVFKELTKGFGIVSSNYDSRLWRENRPFVNSVLKDFGMGRTLLEERITEEISFFLDNQQESEGQPINPRHALMTSVSNVVCSVVFGKRFDHKDPRFIRYIQILERNLQVLGNSGILSVFPWLRHLPGDLFKHAEVAETTMYLYNEFERSIKEHRETANPEENSRDLIDAYIKVIDREEDREDTSFTEYQLVRVIADLFGAGTETTSTTLLWAMMYMVTYPDIQRAIQREIDEVLDEGQPPRWSDRERMPYVQACIHELQRMADIVPFSVPHCTSDDVTLGGYFIPKNTMLLPSLYSAHRDPKLWPEPEKFVPERFLDAEGKLVRREQLIPFSMGKRICLGEGLARMELFLFFVSLFQRFAISTPRGHPPPDMNGDLSLTNAPKPFSVCLHARKT